MTLTLFFASMFSLMSWMAIVIATSDNPKNLHGFRFVSMVFSSSARSSAWPTTSETDCFQKD